MVGGKKKNPNPSVYHFVYIRLTTYSTTAIFIQVYMNNSISIGRPSSSSQDTRRGFKSRCMFFWARLRLFTGSSMRFGSLSFHSQACDYIIIQFRSWLLSKNPSFYSKHIWVVITIWLSPVYSCRLDVAWDGFPSPVALNILIGWSYDHDWGVWLRVRVPGNNHL